MLVGWSRSAPIIRVSVMQQDNGVCLMNKRQYCASVSVHWLGSDGDHCKLYCNYSDHAVDKHMLAFHYSLSFVLDLW